MQDKTAIKNNLTWFPNQGFHFYSFVNVGFYAQLATMPYRKTKILLLTLNSSEWLKAQIVYKSDKNTDQTITQMKHFPSTKRE